MKNIFQLTLAAILGGMISLFAFKYFENSQVDEGPVAVSKTENYQNVSFASNSMASAPNVDFTSASAKAMPAVVHISSTVTRIQRNPFDELFSPFFNAQPRSQQYKSTGSGVITNPNGYIVTNNHVIDGAESIEVTLHDNRVIEATIVGVDESTDLALLKIDLKNLPSLSLGNSEEVLVGEWVLAVGNPFSLNSTVTAGIVSAKARNINILKSKSSIESFIQTDAAVNPGNSGGALVNTRGELIGINTAIASPTGTYAGYAFAVPSNIVNKVVTDLIEFGRVQRGYLGIVMKNVEADLAKSEGLSELKGVFIRSLYKEGSGAKAGLQPKDVITKVNDRPIATIAEYMEQMGYHRPGDKVTVEILRKDKRLNIEAELSNEEGNTLLISLEDKKLMEALGMDLEPVEGKGIKVSALYTGAIASQTDLHEGFVITEVNGIKVENREDLLDILKRENDSIIYMKGIYENYPGKFQYKFKMQ